MIPLPDLAELKVSLSYDQDTGVFIRLPRADRRASWNRQFAGKEAGTLRRDGYVQISMSGVLYLAHHLAWMYVHGELPPGMEEMDHVNGDRTNNRIRNLRPATIEQNRANSRMQSGKSSGLPKGVKRIRGKFIAKIYRRGITKHLGTFDTPELAHAAYAAAAVAASGEFARLS